MYTFWCSIFSPAQLISYCDKYLRFQGFPVVLDIELSVSAWYQKTRGVPLRARRLLLLLLPLAAASGGVRHIFFFFKITCNGAKQNNDFVPIKIPENSAASKTHPLENAFFCSRNHLRLPAATMNTKGAMSHMHIVRPTEQLRSSPPGSRGSEHMPLYPSCVRLLECSVSQAMATGALEAGKVVEVAFVRSKIRLTAWAVSYYTDQLITPYFSSGSTINGIPGGDGWARVLREQIGWLP